MTYKITIREIKVNPDPNRTDIETEVYCQRVEDIDLYSVIQAVNKAAPSSTPIPGRLTVDMDQIRQSLGAEPK